MGMCATAPEVAQSTIPVLRFEQSEEALAANGGLVYRSPDNEMPVGRVGYDSQFVYFIRNEKELIAAKRDIN